MQLAFRSGGDTVAFSVRADGTMPGEILQEIVDIVTSVAGRGIGLHGFGVKTLGLRKLKDLLSSADSMAWSTDARYLKSGPLPGCAHGVGGKGNCANCPIYALRWREKLLASS